MLLSQELLVYVGASTTRLQCLAICAQKLTAAAAFLVMGSHNTPSKVLFVGSIPLDTTEDVLTRLAGALPGRLDSIPDGETGERDSFVFWQYQVFPTEIRSPMVKQLRNEPPAAESFNVTLDHVKPTMYDDHAIASYGKFCKLREQGKIQPDVRFQVCIPGIIDSILVCVDPLFCKQAEPLYEQRLVESIERLQKAIPASDLAIQFDIAVEFATMEYERGNLKNDMFKPYVLPPAKEAALERVIRLSSHVKEDVHLGYHLCYGDIQHRHFVEPPDMSLMVEFANELLQGVGPSHHVNWMHMPVPKDRTDTTYVQALAELKDVNLFLGLIHANDEEGTRKRIEVARSVYSKPFGIATECGIGRTTREDFQSILGITAALTAA